MIGQFLLTAKIISKDFYDNLVTHHGITYFTTKRTTTNFFIAKPDPFPWDELNRHWMLPVIVSGDLVEIYDGLRLFDKHWRALNHDNLDISKTLANILENYACFFDIDSIEGRRQLIESYKRRFWCDALDTSLTECKMRDNPFKNDFVREVDYRHAETIPTKQIVGSLHPDYAFESWMTIFYTLKRPNTLWKCLISMNSPQLYASDIHLFGGIHYWKYNNDYYVSAGSHRTTASIFMNLDEIGLAPVTYYEQDLRYKDCYDTLTAYGFDIKLYNSYELQRKCLNYGFTEAWEVFTIRYNGQELFLFGLDDIKNYIKTVEAYVEYIKFSPVQKLFYMMKNNFQKFHESITRTLQ